MTIVWLQINLGLYSFRLSSGRGFCNLTPRLSKVEKVWKYHYFNVQYLCNKFCWRTIQFSSGDITLGGLKLHRHFRCLRWTVSPTGVSFSPVTSTRVLRYLRKQKQKTTNKPTGRSLVSGWGVTQFRRRLATFHWRRNEKLESMSLCKKNDYLWELEAKDPQVQPWPFVTHDSILTRIISCKESFSRKRMDVLWINII